MIHSKQHRGCRIQVPGTRGYRRWKTADFSHSARSLPCAPPPRFPGRNAHLPTHTQIRSPGRQAPGPAMAHSLLTLHSRGERSGREARQEPIQRPTGYSQSASLANLRGHSAGTAPIIALFIPGTPLKTTPLQKDARSIQNSIGGAEFRTPGPMATGGGKQPTLRTVRAAHRAPPQVSRPQCPSAHSHADPESRQTGPRPGLGTLFVYSSFEGEKIPAGGQTTEPTQRPTGSSQSASPANLRDG